jgi:hypothetical protein
MRGAGRRRPARPVHRQEPIPTQLQTRRSASLPISRQTTSKRIWISEVDLARWLLLIVHALLGALLLGGALYSIMTVQPRAKAFFKDVREFEAFVANLAHGARWQFLAVLSVIGITGFIGPWFSPHPFLWWIYFSVKCVLWAVILGCFIYVSWYLWPRRILAATAELPAIHREFALAARTILALLLVSFVLGVAMTQVR